MLNALLLLLLFAPQQPSPQNPSPMQDSTREHRRLAPGSREGLRESLPDVLPSPAELFVPARSVRKVRLDLLFLFHGAGFVLEEALTRSRGDWAGVSVNLGSGSLVYAEPFRDRTRFARLLEAATGACRSRMGRQVEFRRVVIAGFSAGYGAVREILADGAARERIHGVLLLDGIHASYVPGGKVIAEGGRIEERDLEAFVDLARDAARSGSRHRFLITHSEIFPGTFVSTTEATDHLLQSVGMRRRPVLRWGPLGMQLLSEARHHRFSVLGFAGNTAPDHVDHLHALADFLAMLMRL